VNNLFKFDEKYRRRGILNHIAGVDESGRGPLAGPVVAAAVVLPSNFKSNNITDSKKLKPAERDKLYKVIVCNAIGVAVSIVKPKIIDSINIFQATYLAMYRAVRKLPIKPDIVLVDGPYRIPKLRIKQEAIIRGDSTSLSIAAASIIAKVTRDNLMFKLDKIYPQYKFCQNKGYPTRQHFEALRIYGISPVHRQSFNMVNSK
jgi:ribonuclease HII